MPKKSKTGSRARQISPNLSLEAKTVLDKYLEAYPDLGVSRIINGALLFLAKQDVMGLNANCEPIDPDLYADRLEKLKQREKL